MKRIFAVFLCICMLFSVLAVLTSALERPSKTAGELVNRTTIPDMGTLLNKLHLTGSPYCSEKTLLETSWKKLPIESSKLADIGNHFKYGISVIGVSCLERPVTGAADMVWASGNIGETVSSGAKARGAFAWLPDGNLYNVQGEVAGENQGASEGYRYQTLLTFNFGKIANLTAIGYATGPNNSFQAADVYVSDNGTDWTLVGSYDRIEKRMDGMDYSFVKGNNLGTDESDKSLSETDNTLFFDLPANTKGQFIRIAGTTGAGKSTPEDPTKYEDYTNDVNTSSSFRELFVFGTLTDEVGYVWNENEDDTPVTDDNAGQTTLPSIIVKPNQPTQTAEKTAETTAPITEVPDTDIPADEKAGCQSIAGGICVIFVTAAATGVAICRRKD